MSAQSYLGRTFEIIDKKAYIRDPDDLRVYIKDPATGAFLQIPIGTQVRVEKLQWMEAGKTRKFFVFAQDVTTGAPLGWTAAINLEGGLIGETLEPVEPEAGANRFSSTAAWSNGTYLGQVPLVQIVGSGSEVELIAESTAAPFMAMCEAARGEGVSIQLNSGFRSWGEQKLLREGWEKGLPGYYRAAKPGYSNHQNGIAFDIDVDASYSSGQYRWLAKNATAHGFLRTVSGEPHHWEYRPEEAAAARAAGRHALTSVNP